MTTKKAFQYTISKIRKDWRVYNHTPAAEYPKAMMTNQQIEKMTATVNCGGEWLSGTTEKEIANFVMNDQRFLDFLEKYNAVAEIESFYHYSCIGYQIRIKFGMIIGGDGKDYIKLN